MWLSNEQKQAFNSTKRQDLESTAQKGRNGYFTLAKKNSHAQLF